MLAIVGCAGGVASENVFVYIMCFVMLAATILFGLLLLAVSLIWKWLSADFRKTHEGKQGRFSVIIFFTVVPFFFVAAFINRLYLHDASRFIRLLGVMMAFAFAVFCGASLLRRTKAKIIVASGIVFILFVALLSFVNSTILKSGKIADDSSINKLMSLGYLAWVPAKGSIEKSGVTEYNPELAFKGINIYKSRNLNQACLIDMHGNILHKWDFSIDAINDWHHIEVCWNGDLLAVGGDRMLVRLDWDSKLKWKKRMRVHHDVFIDENKKIYTVAREDDLVFWHWIPVPVLNDCIVVLSPDGKIEKKVYLYDLVKEQLSLQTIARIYCCAILKPVGLMRILYYKAKMGYVCEKGTYFDIMHTNSIEIMDRDIEGFCKKGDWLTSIRELDLVGVIDPEKQEFVWSWGPGDLGRQHHPTLLKNGNLLIFDNRPHRGFSRIVELDPLTKKILWEYESQPPEKFYSEFRGGNQRLPNGNTLITESDKGRVFEITKGGRVVWEFYNPEVKQEDKKRAAIYRMMRITNPEKYTHLARLE